MRKYNRLVAYLLLLVLVTGLVPQTSSQAKPPSSSTTFQPTEVATLQKLMPDTPDPIAVPALPNTNSQLLLSV